MRFARREAGRPVARGVAGHAAAPDAGLAPRQVPGQGRSPRRASRRTGSRPSPARFADHLGAKVGAQPGQQRPGRGPCPPGRDLAGHEADIARSPRRGQERSRPRGRGWGSSARALPAASPEARRGARCAARSRLAPRRLRLRRRDAPGDQAGERRHHDRAESDDDHAAVRERLMITPSRLKEAHRRLEPRAWAREPVREPARRHRGGGRRWRGRRHGGVRRCRGRSDRARAAAFGSGKAQVADAPDGVQPG